MRKWKLAAAATAASGILAVGLFAAFSLTAKAGTAAGCLATPPTPSSDYTSPLTCTSTNTAAAGNPIAYPETITFTAATSTASAAELNADLPVTFKWTTVCTEQSGGKITSGPNTYTTTGTGAQTMTLVQDNSTTPTLSMNALDPTTCDVTATATVVDAKLTATELDVTVTDTQSAAATATSASPTPSATTSTTTAKYNNQVHGFDGTCLDDKGNSSARRASVIIWTCNNTDQAQGWSHSGSELKIHGMCLNAKGNGKQGSKLILWNCTGTGNEIFSHRSNGEFVEKANGYKLCIDDPGYSTKNGTQPFVYACNDGANQRWSMP
jgi:hypothetical protein